MAVLSYLVEIESTAPDPSKVMKRLKREVELQFGDAGTVTEFKGRISWVNGG